LTIPPILSNFALRIFGIAPIKIGGLKLKKSVKSKTKIGEIKKNNL